MQTPQQIQVAAELKLPVILEAQQWNMLLGVLFDTPNLPLPHRMVAGLVQAISDQLQQGAVQSKTVEPERPEPPPLNGLDHGLDHAA